MNPVNNAPHWYAAAIDKDFSNKEISPKKVSFLVEVKTQKIAEEVILRSGSPAFDGNF